MEAMKVVYFVGISVRGSSVCVGLGAFHVCVRSSEDDVPSAQLQRRRQVEDAIANSVVLTELQFEMRFQDDTSI